jgi:hypothetical protein
MSYLLSIDWDNTPSSWFTGTALAFWGSSLLSAAIGSIAPMVLVGGFALGGVIAWVRFR